MQHRAQPHRGEDAEKVPLRDTAVKAVHAYANKLRGGARDLLKRPAVAQCEFLLEDVIALLVQAAALANPCREGLGRVAGQPRVRGHQ